jgi:hypothetical protein
MNLINITEEEEEILENGVSVICDFNESLHEFKDTTEQLLSVIGGLQDIIRAMDGRLDDWKFATGMSSPEKAKNHIKTLETK